MAKATQDLQADPAQEAGVLSGAQGPALTGLVAATADVCPALPRSSLYEAHSYSTIQTSPSSSSKAMAAHSSTLAWRIPGTGEPRRLPSMGSQSRTRLKRLSSSSSSSSPLLPPGDISAIFPFHGGTIEAQDSRLKGAEQRWTQLIHLPAGPQIFSPAPPRNLGSSSPDHRPTDASLASRHESRAAK